MDILSFLLIDYAIYGHAYCNNAIICGKNLQPNIENNLIVIRFSFSEYFQLFEGG